MRYASGAERPKHFNAGLQIRCFEIVSKPVPDADYEEARANTQKNALKDLSLMRETVPQDCNPQRAQHDVRSTDR
jgi:hypothetical protein